MMGPEDSNYDGYAWPEINTEIKGESSFNMWGQR